MNIFINGTEFTLTELNAALARITKAAVIIEGTPYNVDDKALLEKVAPKKAHHLTFRWLDDKRPLPHRVTILDRVWQYDKNGTYGRKLDLHEDMMGFLINGTDFKLISIEPMGRYSPIIINGSHYDVDKGERLHAIAHSQAEELKITGVSFEQEITILDRVWSCKPGSSTYHPKVDIVFPSLPTLPFPHAGQVVSLDGVEVEVCHVTASGVVFWHNPEDDIYGVIRVEKLRPSLIETMRADLAKGLGPKELIALGWSRKIS
jgi:hypothetical protein